MSIDSAANELGMTIEKRIIWMCPECWLHFDEPGTCAAGDCRRKLVERHAWICPNPSCGQSYPGNRKPPEHCEACGESFRRV